ncbi:MAG: hypothetical protein CMQ15_10525 [Gammaproteobacteria bacterium]|jgi:hypothetical protein|nr:hypothetical protein [Gammaproteobacteria bacterium]HJN94967.1 DUF6644 family protein [Gammaproteobacteria bacterium]|tara:strand:- start:1979 stop:2593 length:615 start_codon:yes stop_codon:yes gene_type:complete
MSTSPAISTSPALTLGSYRRTITSIALVLIILVFALSSARRAVWVDLYDFFLWMETTWFGVIGKTWGAAFAVVEAFHLLAMALLGGAVFVADFRLLGWSFLDVPAQEVLDKAHKVFLVGLIVVLSTGIFMACGVAGKLYWLPVFWYKMLALTTGILFVFFIKRPLLNRDLDEIKPWVVKLVAVASLLVWITVAATGRWIGFAGS